MKKIIYILFSTSILVSCTKTPQQRAEQSVKDFNDKKESDYDGGKIKWDMIELSQIRKDTLKFSMTQESNDILDSMNKYGEERLSILQDASMAINDASLAILRRDREKEKYYNSKADSLKSVDSSMGIIHEKFDSDYKTKEKQFGNPVYFRISMKDKIIGMSSGDYLIDTTTFNITYMKISLVDNGYKPIKQK